MKFLETIDLEYAEKYRSAIFMHARWNPPSSWQHHIPFAFFLMAMLRPNKFVELGTYLGSSFFAFCQAAQQFELDTYCYAVDTWEGDEHIGEYGKDIYDSVSQEQKVYEDKSELLRMTFDEASKLEKLNNIDLLHIDGFHTYDAVKNDFETWLPKMSDEGVIIFHDTEVKKDDFGVWKLWKEISKKYPSANFRHGHGLGMLLVGKKVKKDLRKLVKDKNFLGYEHLFQIVGMSI